ncbi:hypothetical protein CH63R_00070 [Colletotrichum higginsianum IMI 349063]|uniref:Uncharacterized protein n=1 Tax=Colletotrichum higginsianum (strain IMI 349063) TaxID=759273 RepID=A0A1B7YS68_COLHI|nr:hypothetical protein CH63R_00070 [Colletotrichum higginsianum IMI 349063]OBR14890.1 hypothetical protein CH63R_00070 [Colletotrichum higginsianum IMI 349063]
MGASSRTSSTPSACGGPELDSELWVRGSWGVPDTDRTAHAGFGELWEAAECVRVMALDGSRGIFGSSLPHAAEVGTGWKQADDSGRGKRFHRCDVMDPEQASWEREREREREMDDDLRPSLRPVAQMP